MKYKLVPGKCEDCAFFGEKSNGFILCAIKSPRKCQLGITCYKEVLSTNGDKIRAMSNEELAEFLEENNCPPGMDGARCPARCSICWLKWLNAEAKEEK